MGARIATVVALVAGVVLAFLVLTGGDDAYVYRVQFETGGQLVDGNQVLVGGQPVGTVEDIGLTEDGQAEVEISVSEPLHEGTTAVIRATSLSGIANRYVSLDPGPDSSDEIPDGAVLAAEDTTAPVDLDQLFNTFDKEARRSLSDVIEGSATLYAGNNEEARETYKYFAPALQSTQRLLRELTRDERVFSEFLVSGSRVLGAVAERRDDLSALTANANQALAAIAAENEALDRSLAAFPPAMRQANTTFVNLRAALDDLDSLVATAKPATRDLDVFFRDLRPVAERAVPVVGDLRDVVARPGGDNDLTDILRVSPRVEDAAASAAENSIEAMDDSEPNIEFARPYTPDLLAFMTKIGQASGYYDIHGHFLRAMPVATGAFDYDLVPSLLDPIFGDASQQLDFFETFPNALDPDGFERCPGGGTQPAEDLSSPYIDPPLEGGAPAGDCAATDAPPGPTP